MTNGCDYVKISQFLKIDPEHVADCLQEAGEKLDGAPAETDFGFLFGSPD